VQTKQFILKRLAEDLRGPMNPQEKLTDYPSDTYVTGILFPQKMDLAGEEIDRLQAEGVGHKEPSDVAADEISLATVKRPASAGISLCVESDKSAPVIRVSVRIGIYTPEPDTEAAAEDDADADTDDKAANTSWIRHEEHYSGDITLDFLTKDLTPETTGIEGLGLHFRTSPWGNKTLVTVAVVNSNQLPAEYERSSFEEKCFFQTRIEVQPDKDTRICARPLGGSAADEDTWMSRLIYRDASEYAVGHTCSAVWNIDNGIVSSVESTWLPDHTVRTMSAAGVAEFSPLTALENGPVLSASWLSETSGKALIDGLRMLTTIYGDWVETQISNVMLEPKLREQAEQHAENARSVNRRMSETIDRLARDADAQTAFRLANRAILLQRQWSYPDATDLVWRPFQLGFMLLTMSAIICDDSDEKAAREREIVDLLWFPTGGGKTEAYLGLIAFTLFFRRLKFGDFGAGVAALMRYTLRLLTIQQFQRATAMICACDALRLGDNLPEDLDPDLGDKPFSIGLWVGSDATPNNFSDAVDALSSETTHSRPDQLLNCPRHGKSRLNWKQERLHNEIRAYCPEEDCLWSENSDGLPVWTVDDNIYEHRPSLLIGTVDKFAQVARRPETSGLFSSDETCRQPDLIIQDELHLISGPLGTLTGLYEIAFDRLCTRHRIRPKVIASTATIRQAASQIEGLFDRETCLFPPPLLDAANSGFAVEDQDDPGRLYIGVTTAGRSAKFVLQAVAASLLQSAGSDVIPESEKDDFWTLVTYFNSLRELGGALVLLQDDVLRSLDVYAARRGETPRTIDDPRELTSRVSSSEIKEILRELETPRGNEGCRDTLLASNMISVGVDVPRLGSMIVNGQPKSIAEYIQATSRVGRRPGGPGGIVITSYNNAKSRDRSHFETFRTWHSALYREVEATSVTPFAPRARDKALHAVLVILARHLIPGLTERPGTVEQYRSELEDFIQYIHDRAARVDPEEARAVEAALQEFLDDWIAGAGRLKQYWNDRQSRGSLLISAEKAAEQRARTGRYYSDAEPTPNSMRNVEPGVLFKLEEILRMDDGS